MSFFVNKYIFFIFFIISVYLFLLSPSNRLNEWQKIKARGYISWVTRPSPLTYYDSLDGIIGLEYNILNEFCIENELLLNVILSDSNSQLFELLTSKRVDVAGANLTATKSRLSQFLSTNAYDETSVKLVSSIKNEKIKTLDYLAPFTGEVLANSSYVNIANKLINEYNVSINFNDNKNLYELLQSIADGEIDYTLTDSNILLIYQSYLPILRVGLSLSETNELVFLLPKFDDFSVQDKLNEFLNRHKNNGNIESYKKIILNSLPLSKPADTVQFLKNYNKRWSNIKDLIYSIANKYELNPILLGALSYQESHWNANAVSPTLVKGIMMLTKGVAKEQNVTDRLDPLQSLDGGARHFIKTLKKIPQRINQPDRIKFALVSYNIGFGNLEKARVMAQKAGKNPDFWKQVKPYLKKLNETSNGRVDGETAVKYVENIQVYKNLLQWKEQQ